MGLGIGKKLTVVLIAVFVISLIPIMFDQQQAYAVSSTEIVVETIPVNEGTINPGEILVLVDTTGINMFELISVTANLPCGVGPTSGAGNDLPDLKIIAGTFGNTFDVVAESGDDTGFAGPHSTCVFRDLANSTSQGVTVNTLILTNDGTSPITLPKLIMVTLTGAFEGITTAPPPSNDPPTANAGIDQTVDESILVTLDGSGSFDPNSDPLTYSWTQTMGSIVVLSDPTAINPTFTAPEVTTTTILEFNLQVSDGQFTDNDTVSITVEDDGGSGSTATYEDDFTTDNFADSGTEIGVAGGVLDSNITYDGSHHGSKVLLSQALSETWVITFDMHINVRTGSSTNTSITWIGMFDSDETASYSTTGQDALMIGLEGTGGIPDIGIMSRDNQNLNVVPANFQGDILVDTTTYYVEFFRTNATSYGWNIYTDPARTTLLAGTTHNTAATVDDLKYFGVLERNEASNGVEDFTIDNLQIWDGVSP